MIRSGFRTGAIAGALFAALLSACGGSSGASQPPEATASSVPAASPPAACGQQSPPALLAENGIYFGVNLDWDEDSPAAYAARLGKSPAVYVLFAKFPLSESALGYVYHIAELVKAQNGALMLTLEPNAGLDTVTTDSANALAGQLAGINARGVPVYLRFAHEMNGSWYTWSQDPATYVRAFREVAAAVHAEAPGTAMVWAPNYGGGYPFNGGQHGAVANTEAYALLDTNGDGLLSAQDDPYAPYYPGDEAVDWVGMSLYHWGATYPWGENELPEAGKFVAQLTGDYNGTGGDDSDVPDFYADYAIGHDKPLAITETAPFYAVGVEGDPEFDLKQSWWQQVFADDLAQAFPKLKMINWFEWRKFESEVGGEVDWTVTRDPELRAAFHAALPASLRFATPGAC
ncbi:MAG TPA: glycosyl hydrolase [Dehalococcoidia bacterium]|nr:glycosyl hydrolase [Dehalococcoidia bacterium]